MDLLKREIVGFLFFMAVCGSCMATVYEVGDSAGWTIIGNVDYNTWASSKTFQIGDTLIFEYDPRFHNVMQVSRSDFHSCNAAAPISTYATGNDSIVIHSPGHYYYICGFVGHCQAGQKVDIRVPKSHRPASVPISSPAQVPHGTEGPEASPIGPVAPSPSPSGGESTLLNNGLFSYNVGLLLILVWVFNYGFL
ncbi:mavicyanin [Phtheirospermum japonicum]|uniref:Mavicyanin n=1 Tax=Phtheirospermum japonicum TaxID=374723 RepID=A0A830C7E6_9LAMI|nr:mavicyanin [Phtheirospermum japonicum]